METVRFYDVESQTVVTIPAAELAAGAVRAQVEGIEGIVWLLPDKLTIGDYRHPPFVGELLDYIRDIQATFAEHRLLSVEEWADGFRRDAHPEQEIALWCHAANVYCQFLSLDQWSPAERHDAYVVILACLNATPETVWRIISPTALDRQHVQRLIDTYYGMQGE